jgi:hypothetical protein
VSLDLISDDPTLETDDPVRRSWTLFCSVLFVVASTLFPSISSFVPRVSRKFVFPFACSCVTLGVCRAYTPGTHARKEQDGLLLEFPCNPTRTRSVKSY